MEGYAQGGLGHGGSGGLRIAAAAMLPGWLAGLKGQGWVLLGLGPVLLAYVGWVCWKVQRRRGPGGALHHLDKRRSTDELAAAVNGNLLLPLSSSPRLSALALAPLPSVLSMPPAAGAGLAAAAGAAANGGGSWPLSPDSPLHALGARLFGGRQLAKRRSQSWATFDDPGGAGHDGSGGGTPARDISYGSSLNRLGRSSQTFARRAVGTLAEDSGP